jgi:hypothetical protein
LWRHRWIQIGRGQQLQALLLGVGPFPYGIYRNLPILNKRMAWAS